MKQAAFRAGVALTFLGYSGISNASECSEVLSGTSVSASSPCYFVGMIEGSNTNYYRNTSYFVLPSITVLWHLFYIDNLETGVYFAGQEWDNSYWYSSAHIAYEQAPYDVKENNRLGTLPKKQDSTAAGLSLVVGGSWGQIELEGNRDIGNVPEGYELDLSYNYPLNINGVVFSPMIGVRYLDDKKADYSFSVAKTSSSSRFPEFKAEAGYEVYMAGSITYEFKPRWNLYYTSEYRAITGDLADSPLVEERQAFSNHVGIFYQF